MPVKDCTLRYTGVKLIPPMAKRLAARWHDAEDSAERVTIREQVQSVRPASHAAWLAALLVHEVYKLSPSQGAFVAEALKPPPPPRKPKREMFHSVRRRTTGA